MKWTSPSSHWNVACTHHEVDITIITLKCTLYSPWSGHHHNIEMDVHFVVSTSYISMLWWCPLHGEYKLHFNVMMVMSTSWWVQATFQCDDDDVHFMVRTSYISMWWWCPLHGEYKLHFNVMMMSTSWWVQATFQCDDDVHFMVSTRCSLYSPWGGHHDIEM
jgi:hypothetical protein